MRVATRPLQALAGLAALLATTAWLQPPASGADLWWHLAAGRQIWELGGPPATDSLSFTFAGERWLNHEWLWDAVVWRLYALDPQAVAWAQLGLLVAIFATAWETARRATGSLLAAGGATVVAAATCHWFLDIRPHAVTLLFTLGILLTRDHPKAPWGWPILVALWTNLHSGFVFGIGVIGLLVATKTAAASWRARRIVALPLEWTSLAVCGLAWMANPWGYEIIEYPLQYLDSDSPFREILEWHATPFSLDPRYFAGRFHLAAILAAAGLPLAFRRAPLTALLCLVTFAMAATSRRFVPLFAISSVVPVALLLAWLQDQLLRRVAPLRSPAAAFATAGAGIAAGGFLVAGIDLTPRLLERWTTSDRFPREAVRYLNALGPPARVLNPYEWGGYLLLHAPESRVFIDGRANTLYDAEIFLTHRALRRGLADLPAMLERTPADAALLRSASPWSRALKALPEPWVQVYEDHQSRILLPPDSPLLAAGTPTPEQVLGRGWESHYPRYKLALLRGDRAAAIRELEAVVENDPLRVGIWGRLAFVHAFERDLGAIRDTIANGVRAVPRRESELRGAESRAYAQAGNLPLAIAAARRSLAWGPFASLAASQKRIAQLQSSLAAARSDGEH